MTRAKGQLPCHCDAGVSAEGRCQNCDQKVIRPIDWGWWYGWMLAVASIVVTGLVVYSQWLDPQA